MTNTIESCSIYSVKIDDGLRFEVCAQPDGKGGHVLSIQLGDETIHLHTEIESHQIAARRISQVVGNAAGDGLNAQFDKKIENLPQAGRESIVLAASS